MVYFVLKWLVRPAGFEQVWVFVTDVYKYTSKGWKRKSFILK